MRSRVQPEMKKMILRLKIVGCYVEKKNQSKKKRWKKIDTKLGRMRSSKGGGTRVGISRIK